ncbi:MAG: GNAT family N-acetyltransferase [Gammaproteobacteria bacterium]
MTTLFASGQTPVADSGPRDITLRDGRHIILRAIRPDDAVALRSAFERLSGEARLTRFMAPMKQLPVEMLERAVNPSPGEEVALVAVSADDGGTNTIVAGGRYIADARNETAEFAVTVANEWQGLGLATALLKELIRRGRAQGLRFIEGYVLARNRPMLECARRLGFEVVTDAGDPGTLRVRLQLRPD